MKLASLQSDTRPCAKLSTHAATRLGIQRLLLVLRPWSWERYRAEVEVTSRHKAWSATTAANLDTLQRNAARKIWCNAQSPTWQRGGPGERREPPRPHSQVKERVESGVSKEAANNQGQDTTLIVLTGTIKGIPARFLVDGGATHNFIDEKLLWEWSMISLAKESPDTIKLANGQMKSSSLVLPKARTHIGTYKHPLKLHATRLKGFEILAKNDLQRPTQTLIEGKLRYNSNTMARHTPFGHRRRRTLTFPSGIWCRPTLSWSEPHERNL